MTTDPNQPTGPCGFPWRPDESGQKKYLVDRLRECAAMCDPPTGDLYALAADEIDRLRAALGERDTIIAGLHRLTNKKEDSMKMLISRERLWQKIVNDPDVDVDAGLPAVAFRDNDEWTL